MHEWHFSSWLTEQMQVIGRGVYDLSLMTGLKFATIVTHCNKGHKIIPTFEEVVDYCGAFGLMDQVNDIWERVCGERNRQEQERRDNA